MTAPVFESPEKTIVLMASGRPMAYVIPFFQPEVRFLGLWNNFSRPLPQFGDRPPPAVDVMLEMVRSHDGELYLLTPGRRDALERYGITIPRDSEFVARRVAPQVMIWRAEVQRNPAP